ncbi:MAG: hypothetical protein AB7T49_13960 [Oligoflexales bacterium]
MTESVVRNQLRACYWNSEKKFFGINKALLEKHLKSVGRQLLLKEISTLEEMSLSPCDILIVASDHVPHDKFAGWLTSIQNKIIKNNGIWVPAIFVSSCSFENLLELLKTVYQSNFYFDVVASEHLDSLPIRVANLLRIHDHLHELQRYEKQYNTLQADVKKLEEKLRNFES